MAQRRTVCWNRKVGFVDTEECSCYVGPFQSLTDEAYIQFTYPRHGNQLVEEIFQQRIRGQYLDCIINTASGTIAVNKSIISSFSRYINAVLLYANHPQFRPLLTAQVLKPEGINLDHLSSSAVLALMDCAYCGYLVVPTDGHIRDIIDAANFLCVASVSVSPTSIEIHVDRAAYIKKLVEDLAEQRRRRAYVDFVIPIGSLKIFAHQSVLSAFSEYFDGTQSPEHFEKNIHFQSLDPASVEALVNFAYTGKIAVSTCAVLELVRAADFLGFKEVSKMCYEYLRACLTFENCVPTYKRSGLSDNKRQQRDVKKYIFDNFSEVSRTDKFLDLDLGSLIALLQEDDLILKKLHQYDCSLNKYFCVPPNEQEHLIFELARRYATHYSADKNQILLQLMAHAVRMPLIGLPGLVSIKKSLLDDPCEILVDMVTKAITVCLATMINKNVNLFNGHSPRWMIPRTIPRLRLDDLGYPETDYYPRADQCERFDDSTLFDLPIQYITGMKMFVRPYGGEYFLSGLLVTYNHNHSVLHGTEQPSGPLVSFDLDRDERITGIMCRARRPETHLIHIFGVKTNKGAVHCYFAPGIDEENMIIPENSSYFTHLTGSVDIIDGQPTLRDVKFFFALDELSKK